MLVFRPEIRSECEDRGDGQAAYKLDWVASGGPPRATFKTSDRKALYARGNNEDTFHTRKLVPSHSPPPSAHNP